MPTSTSNIFRRVNRRRPCKICGKPDWRVYVRNQSLSVCMRVRDGARKINRHGGAIFIHDDWREEKGIDVCVVTDLPQWPIAPIENGHFPDAGSLRGISGFWDDWQGVRLWKPKDYLLPITSISVQRWLDRLSPQFRRIAMARLFEIAEVSWITRNRRC